MTIDEKLKKLRAYMAENNIDAVIIPSSDAHQSEYSARCFAMREWISGFTGSAGTVVVTASHAGVWVDSRYFIQCEKEIEGTEYVMHPLVVQTAAEWVTWIAENMTSGQTVGIDGRVFSLASAGDIRSTLSSKGIKLALDFCAAAVWEDRPSMPTAPVYVHDIKTAGKSAVDKISAIRTFLRTNRADAIVIDALDEVAYTLNVRGADVACNPVTYAYLAISDTRAILFIDEVKLSAEVKEYLQSIDVEVRPYGAIEDWLKEGKEGDVLCVDAGKFSAYHRELLSDDVMVKNVTSPVAMAKCIKNQAEIEGMRRAMLKDAVALTEFFRRVESEAVEKGYDEADLASMVIDIRRKQEGYITESFGAIVGYKENGAIVHYRPEKGQAKKIEGSGMILIDTGGQYKDGTTDITRVWYIGEPSDEEKRAYTAVLKAHIAIERLVFPAGYSGPQLDAIARKEMWAYHLNYGHGTGHGVGAAMNVHEGPVSFGNKGIPVGVPMQEGMIVSDEPGYYKTGGYGIRIENCVLIEKKHENELGEWLGFKYLTLCPIETRLIDIDMMKDEEIEWLNAYHADVLAKVLPLVEGEDAKWLAEKCAPLYRK